MFDDNNKIKIVMVKGEKGDTGDAGDYSGLINKPKINGVALDDDKTSSDLGLASETEMLVDREKIETAENDIKALSARADTLNALPGTAVPRKIGYFVDKTYAYDGEAHYYGMQGLTLVDDETVAYISLHRNSSGSVDSDTTRIRKFSLTTGAISNEYTVDTGHGNDMQYFDGKYYVTPASSYNGTSGYAKTVKVFDESFNLIKSIATEHNYDSVFVHDGEIYVGIAYGGDLNAGHIAKLTDNGAEYVTTLQLPSGHIGSTQVITYSNGCYMWVMYNPNSVYVFDETGNFVRTIHVTDTWINQLGELEGICFKSNGDTILGTQFTPNQGAIVYDMFYNTSFTSSTPISAKPRQHNNMNFYVDNSTMDAFFHSGTSTSPFFSLDEVLMMDVNANVSVNLVQSTSPYVISRINGFTGSIGGTSQTITLDTASSAMIIRASKISFISCNLPPIKVNTSLCTISRSTCNASTSQSAITAGYGGDVHCQTTTINVQDDKCISTESGGRIIFGDGNSFNGIPNIPRNVAFLSKVRVAQLNVGDTVQLTTSSFDNIDKLWITWYYSNFSQYIDCSGGKKYLSCIRNIDDTKQRVFTLVLNLDATNKTITLESQCYVEQTASSFTRTAITQLVNVYLLT